MGKSDVVTTAAVIFLFSVPILAGGIWLKVQSNDDCYRFLDRWLLGAGAALMVVVFFGLLGVYFEQRWLVKFYMVSTFLLLLLVFALTAFAFAVADRIPGEVVDGVGYRDFYLGSSKNWLQKQVTKAGNWGEINSCLKRGDACGWMLKNSDSFDKFILRDLGPIQSGCCKPPWECGFSFGNATTWYRRADKNISSNSDCKLWDNDPSKLCYDCQSCKAGVMSNLKSHWRKMAVMIIVFLSVLLVVIYPIAYCAFKSM